MVVALWVLAPARATTFVECGPGLVISPEWRGRILPFPPNFELLWADLRNLGCRLGVIDGVSLRHLAPAASGYDGGHEKERLETLLRSRGLGSLRELQGTIAA